MTDDETGEMIERDKKVGIIELEIEPLVEPIRNKIWPAIKSKLMAMSALDLRNISIEIRGCTPTETMALIIAGIADDEDQQLAE